MKSEKEYIEVLNTLRALYVNNSIISSILESIEPTEYYKINNAWKILNNPRIMSTINVREHADVLKSIIKDDDDAYKNICKLVGVVYGESAKKIIQERPELTMRDFPNFDIFDEQIRKTIGYGGVHTFLTYYMSSEHIITELVQNPELIKYYKEFENLTGDFFPPSAIGLEDRLLAFRKHKDLVISIVDSGKQSELASNLQLLLRDEEGFSNEYLPPDLKTDLRVDTLEQLENYSETRKGVLQKYIDQGYNIRNIILFKHFGIIKNSPGQYNKYEHKKLLKDYLQFNKTDLTEDELDLIEIYSILEDPTVDPEILKQIDEFLSSRDDVVTPLRMKSIDAKVVENYKREYMDSLITLEQARQMAEDPENKSYRYIFKKNGDICYPTKKECSDGSCIYKDHIVTKQRRKIIPI